MPNKMDYDEWIAYGKENHWCSELICSTHTGIPLDADEDKQFSEGFDPCVYTVRIYENEKQSISTKEHGRNG